MGNARLHSLLADSPDLPEDVKGAVKRSMEELKLYLVSTGEASMLACEQGVERLRRSFVDLLKQEVKKGMTPIYAAVATVAGAKVQKGRTELLSERLNKDFKKLLDKAIDSMESNIRGESEVKGKGKKTGNGGNGGGSLSLQAITTVDLVKSKLAAEQMRSARQELHKLVGSTAAKGLNIEIVASKR